MTQEEITDLARESGLWLYGLGKDETNFNSLVAKFAYLVAAAEREACAQACDVEIARVKPIYSVTAENCAKAIRARGEK